MTDSKVRSQLLGKRPGSAPLCEVYHTRVANLDTSQPSSASSPWNIVRHIQRVPAKPPTAHGPLLVGYGTTPLGVGGCGLAARTRRPQPRLGLGLGVGIGLGYRRIGSVLVRVRVVVIGPELGAVEVSSPAANRAAAPAAAQ
eukprot:scaffold76464_cov74-Phaeocystis_antarctica.AAC.1